MKKMKHRFTLVEIMIVVAIIAILAAIAIPNFIRYRKTSQMNACISNLTAIRDAAEQSKLEGHGVADADLFGQDKYIKVKPNCPGDTTKSYTVTDDAEKVFCFFLAFRSERLAKNDTVSVSVKNIGSTDNTCEIAFLFHGKSREHHVGIHQGPVGIF